MLRLIGLIVVCSASCTGATARPNAPTERAKCAFAAGALPEDTLGDHEPHGREIPIDHFIVVMQENRSFDHYFQMLPAHGETDMDVAPSDFQNPDPQAGGNFRIFHKTALCESNPRHGWSPVHRQYANGAQNGFVTSNGPHGHAAMGYYDESELPYYYGLAQAFAIADHYFCDVLGPTFPNRLFAQSGTAFGVIADNQSAVKSDEQNIYRELALAKVSWAIYSDGRTYEEDIYPGLRGNNDAHFADMQRFYRDASAGHLPAFAWVESLHTNNADALDEHPPADVQLGQQFVAKVIDAVMHSPNWPKAALLLTYDEHGGYFDHVSPPTACAPDNIAPMLSHDDTPGRFNRLGMRVPLIAISPFAKPHHVSHAVYSHASILRLVEARFDLPAMSARDANANPLFDTFDFTRAQLLRPPALPEAAVDASLLTACEQQYP